MVTEQISRAPGGTRVQAPADMRAGGSTKVLRSAMKLFSTQPLTWATSLATLILLPRYLTDEQFGQWSVAFGLATLVATFSLLGMPTYLPRRLASDPSRGTIDGAAALVCMTLSALIAALALATIVPLLHLVAIPGELLALTAVIVVAVTAQRVLIAVFAGQERHGRLAMLTAADTSLTRCASLGAAVVGGGVLPFAAAWCVATTLVTLAGWWSSGVRLCRAAFDPHLWRQLAWGGFPFLAWDMALIVRNQIDVPLAGVLLHMQAAGWLAAAYRVISFPVFIPVLITTPLLPALTRQAAEPSRFRQTLRQSLVAVLILSVPASAISIAMGPAIPGLLRWDAGYLNSVPLIMILAARQPVTAFNWVLATALTAMHLERRWLIVAALGALLNPSLNLVLIPAFDAALGNGAIGAAIAEVSTEVAMLTATLLLSPRGLLDRRTAWLCGRVMLAGLALLVVSLATAAISLALSVVVGGLVYLLVLFALRVVQRENLMALQQSVLQPVLRRFQGARAS